MGLFWDSYKSLVVAANFVVNFLDLKFCDCGFNIRQILMSAQALSDFWTDWTVSG